DEEQYDINLFESKKKSETPASVVPKSIEIMETISVSDLARKMNLKAAEIIGKLFAMGMMVKITESIDSDTAILLASEYGCDVKLVSLYDETVIESDKGSEDSLLPRPPIVTVMGHVDHGKTKTLDAIRHAHVAEGEAGGITQSIGAYSVRTEKGAITFLDTPGHEAFTMMRARGAQVTDIVVLVVAADDGVMPQTLEAIAHAKDAKVPIIVAVNKCDKPEANPDRVKTQLSEQGLTPEEWGGDTQYVHISALKKEGIDDLLDAILLQAEMLELKATYECRAEGKILESRIDQGRGVVSSVIVQRGTLHQGDPFVAGIYSGRVRALFDDRGNRVQEAGPSMPVEVLGMEEMPNAGDPFQVTESEKEARAISTKRQELKRFEDAKAVKKVTLDNLYSTIEQNEIKEFKVIIKADLQGSAEALKASLEKLSTKDIRLVVIHSSAGAINESDVTLAAADSNAIIIGFNVRPTPKAKLLADQESVDIRKYNIIYKCVEEIQAAMEGMLQPDTKEQVIGGVEVRNTFKVPKVGVIAGCYVTDGCVRRSSMINLIRDGIVKYTGKITSLKRFKDDAKEVASGFECGIGLENWQDIQVGDHFEVFEYIEVARKLGDELHDDRAANEKKAAEAAKKAMAEAASKNKDAADASEDAE
ncbi:MAG: translation initiation factor IF-2, partial [Treponema porcinum]|nr:translation initiation factor IF-2 [Treponema porcinum]